MPTPTSFEILNGATVPANTFDPLTNPYGDVYYKLYQVGVRAEIPAVVGPPAVPAAPASAYIKVICRPFAIEGGAGGGGSGMPNNKDAAKYQFPQMSDNGNGSTDDPTLWQIDYLRWH